MKEGNEMNVFWAFVWFIVACLAILGVFYKACAILAGFISIGMCSMFVYEFIRWNRMK